MQPASPFETAAQLELKGPPPQGEAGYLDNKHPHGEERGPSFFSGPRVSNHALAWMGIEP
jgi:hypothetical protein